ncbi:squalene/phytoene synthase family protein [Roseobacter sinensis]|uniref:Squalene/phytoene synthase family protein n=1 Tax=Roseobacter sinensis TaxID=2931391 RepID=A0ABT3BG56_9RHOB|nr:squalene/phytoene synthase family protein [Roseobacter sp. WL0113]MCV3272364.1 squalene/phytoene synthase family protein [Roseobacter sp. WL0113]
MTFDADLNACAALVRQGDPDRFAATMASPVDARGILFPLYAFNVEVSRAPWVTQEPLIAEMRLQWWRDALDEIAGGRAPRRHEVVTPLADILTPDQARGLDALIDARRWDIGSDPFDDEASLWTYLDATTGTLLWTAAAALGAPAEEQARLRQIARAVALANWLSALPELEARGKRPMHDGRPETLAALAKGALKDLAAQRGLSPASRLALLSGWRARGILKTVARQPQRVARGDLVTPQIGRSLSLIRARILGKI